MNTNDDKPGETLTDQAGHWVRRRHSGAWTEHEQRAFEAWLVRDDEHRRAYDRALTLWNQLDRFKSASFPARVAAQQRRAARRRRHQAGRRVVVAAACGFVILLAIGILPMLSISTETCQTSKGEHRVVTLADGSQAELNTDTELEVSLSEHGRHVDLVHGEAFFSVAHDAARPFEVSALGGHIRDVGTRFDVRAEDRRVEVSVIEGEVEVRTATPGPLSRYIHQSSASGLFRRALQAIDAFKTDYASPVRLVAGEQIAYSDQGELSGVHKARAQAVVAWREGRLVFEMTPLAEVAREIARYHTVEFRFTDPALAQLKVSGSFEIANLPLVLNTLQAAFPIRLDNSDPQHIRVFRKRP